MRSNSKDDEVEDLVAAAKLVSSTSFQLFDDTVRVGATVHYASGNTFEGCYCAAGSGYYAVHAEHAALIHGSVHGEHEVIAIAVYFDCSGKGMYSPSGTCLQMLSDNVRRHKRKLKVILSSRESQVSVFMVKDLLPRPWNYK